MVYDMDLIEPMQKLFQLHSHGQNQLLQLREDITVTPEDLLTMPAGGVTLYGLRYNIAVGVLFIEAWLSVQQAEVISSIWGRLRIQQQQRYPDLRFGSGSGTK
ncbi:malate synthase-like [Sinocyclocheilus anshuiensis]|nr:PREDICTED: malate synthase-like [Sinocyclocheilus anshuiensis]